MSELYSKLLFAKKLGHSLWVPEPDENLPNEYRRRGVSIGDVGIITPDGGFDFLFNACLPASHAINENSVPEDFVPLILETKDIAKSPLWFTPGTIITSSFRPEGGGRVEIFMGGDEHLSNTDLKLKEVQIGQVSIESNEGALLVLPDGASREDIVNIDKLHDHTSKNTSTYHQFAGSRHGQMTDNNSLLLVTGCDKAKSWKIASFCGPSEIQFSGTVDNITYSFLSQCPDSIQTRFGPIPPSATENQCVFLRGLPILLQKRDEVDVNLSDKDKADLTSCSVGNSADTVVPANTYRVPPAVLSMVD